MLTNTFTVSFAEKMRTALILARYKNSAYSKEPAMVESV